LADAESRGLLKAEPRGRWAPTLLGRRFLNDLQASFLPDSVGATASTDPKVLALAARIG
jgi:hypothetical protein